jgi:hypothetical protein
MFNRKRLYESDYQESDSFYQLFESNKEDPQVMSNGEKVIRLKG